MRDAQYSSIAIAHGLEDICEEKPPEPKKRKSAEKKSSEKTGRKKPEEMMP